MCKYTERISKVEKTDEDSKAQLERKILQKSKVSGAGKWVLYYGLMGTEDEQH